MAIIRVSDKLLQEIEGLQDSECFDGEVDGIARAYSWATMTMNQNMVQDDREEFNNSFCVLLSLRGYHKLVTLLSKAEIIEK